MPCSDTILAEVAGYPADETPFSGVLLGKELQKTVIEFIPPAPARNVPELEASLLPGIEGFFSRFGSRYSLLGLGMHPLLTLDQTSVWDHGEHEYYQAYDRIFGLRQHGWLNIQALQINLSYRDTGHLVWLYNRVRALIPYLVAITAASPFVEGRPTGLADNRLRYYRENQARIPEICENIIPERLRSLQDYLDSLERIYGALRRLDGDILCDEWVASRGLIVRFSRPCIEIKALDEQECVRSDMAVCAFVRALVSCRDLSLEEDRDALVELTGKAMEGGTAALRPELRALYRKACRAATDEERRYLPYIERRIESGSLAEQMVREARNEGSIRALLPGLAGSLRTNEPWISR
ncbi:gamma-glutamyl:cysteine ligase YbdK (ATP-grasp superfamily) [Methanolinea mesophila]|uniref:glutamate-cysteine ligase family protein n=1 Tax=Methanolinea mesophila TaxID=547055 RepID=UPI001FD7E187|nr:glutamate-cysteine ligase family protein [Methanolinea mesophila]MBP1928224.1 gamma-glutamyl:cysteine ligase YbdK (ATP-grasp superfamily) [Methanolinea mesophila]